MKSKCWVTHHFVEMSFIKSHWNPSKCINGCVNQSHQVLTAHTHSVERRQTTPNVMAKISNGFHSTKFCGWPIKSDRIHAAENVLSWNCVRIISHSAKFKTLRKMCARQNEALFSFWILSKRSLVNHEYLRAMKNCREYPQVKQLQSHDSAHCTYYAHWMWRWTKLWYGCKCKCSSSNDGKQR